MPATRLFLILDLGWCRQRGLDPQASCRALLRAGVRRVVLRQTEQTLPNEALQELAASLAEDVHAHGGELTANLRAFPWWQGADRLHLHAAALRTCAVAAAALPSSSPISASAHDDGELDAAALLHERCVAEGRAGVDFCFLSPWAVSISKAPAFGEPAPACVSPALLHERLREGRSTRPVVALGGLLPEHVRAVAVAGHVGVALLGGLLSADGCRVAERTLSAIDGADWLHEAPAWRGRAR